MNKRKPNKEKTNQPNNEGQGRLIYTINIILLQLFESPLISFTNQTLV